MNRRQFLLGAAATAALAAVPGVQAVDYGARLLPGGHTRFVIGTRYGFTHFGHSVPFVTSPSDRYTWALIRAQQQKLEAEYWRYFDVPPVYTNLITTHQEGGRDGQADQRPEEARQVDA